MKFLNRKEKKEKKESGKILTFLKKGVSVRLKQAESHI